MAEPGDMEPTESAAEPAAAEERPRRWPRRLAKLGVAASMAEVDAALKAEFEAVFGTSPR